MNLIDPFKEPILTTALPHIDNKQLLDYVQDLKEQAQGGRASYNGSTEGFWRTNILNTVTHPELVKLRTTMESLAQDYLARLEVNGVATLHEYWASVYRDRDFMLVHTHPTSFLSAVYYASATQGHGGDLMFDRGNRHLLSPTAARFHPSNSALTRQWFSLKPVAGMGAIFPAWMPHSVNPYNPKDAQAKRVVFAFNFQLAGGKQTYEFDRFNKMVNTQKEKL